MLRHHALTRFLTGFGLTFCLAGAAVERAEAQQPTPQEAEQLRQNPDLVRERLRASGMTAEQIRARLSAAGYDPALLDAYVPGASLPAPNAVLTADQLAALSLLGVGSVRADGLEAVPLEVGRQPEPLVDGPTRDGRLELFGADVFRRSTTQFQPMLSGPVPENYRLGPGDVLVLVITGDVEFVHTLEVTREGFVLVPQVGQIYVNDMTMGQLRATLRNRLGQAYSGVAEGTTRFDISVGRLRTNQVYVIGEVTQPGAYQLSSVATVLNALYAAGGPSDRGNFRRIEVRRQGTLVATFDLYDYLLRGETGSDVALQQGDVVRVPVHGTRASITGAVVRPAIYELTTGETLSDLIEAAGGLLAEAALERITISRIRPIEQRRAGQPARTVIDVPIEVGATQDIAILPGDSVTVHELTRDVAGFVTLRGNVYQPGRFGWEPGLTLSDLIANAGGFRPATYAGTAHIERLNPEDSTRFLIELRLPEDSLQPFPDDRELRQFDVVTIYGEEDMRAERTVSIGGWVQEPGEYPYRSGMTLKDLVLQAGGLRDGALLEFAEVARLPADRSGGTLSNVVRVPLDSSYVFVAEAETYPLLPGLQATDVAPDFELAAFDHVLILRQPEFELQRTVVVMGEVNLPGRYALRTKTERLSDMIDRVGGVTTSGYVAGARLIRAQDGAGLVDIDLAAALRARGSAADLRLLPGDTLFVPEYNPIVIVEGAVVSPTAVRWKEGESLDYYVAAAGGFRSDADEDRVSVRYASGEIRTKDEHFLWFDYEPEPGPGSTVRVPVEDPDEQLDWSEVIGDVAQISVTLATLIVVLTRL